MDDLSSDGWFAEVSFGARNFHVIGSYADLSGDGNSGDTTQWNLGLGWHALLGQNADLVVEARYVNVDLETGTVLGTISDSGYLVRAGARWRFIRVLELNGFVNYIDLSDGSNTTGEVNLLAYLGPIGLGVGYESDGDADVATAYVRWNFEH